MKAKKAPVKSKAGTTRITSDAPMSDRVAAVLKWFERKGSARVRDDMQNRYAIHAKQSFGVSVANIRLLAREIGTDHALAIELWKTGWYEARMLTSFVADPELVTPSQMDAWAKDFDNWAICDTVCFHLFDKTLHAFTKIKKWSKRTPEFERRAAFALVASVALHDKKAPDQLFLACLPLIASAATDDRNFVKKAVSWALRGIGKRNETLHAAARKLAQDLMTSESSAARWIGRDAAKDLSKPRKPRKKKPQ
jgi:3-methyladenine DNA glycosylase AlkD